MPGPRSGGSRMWRRIWASSSPSTRLLLRARSAVNYIEQKIDEAQAEGQLSWFNQAYRAWRLQAKQHGRSMSYAEARARLRRKRFREILSHPVAHELFPPLPTLNLA